MRSSRGAATGRDRRRAMEKRRQRGVVNSNSEGSTARGEALTVTGRRLVGTGGWGAAGGDSWRGGGGAREASRVHQSTKLEESIMGSWEGKSTPRDPGHVGISMPVHSSTTEQDCIERAGNLGGLSRRFTRRPPILAECTMVGSDWL